MSDETNSKDPIHGLGTRVRKARKAMNIAQHELGKLANMTQGAVMKIEKGQIHRPRRINEIAKALHVTTEYLLNDEPLIADAALNNYSRLIVDTTAKAGEWAQDHSIAEENRFPVFWSFRDEIPNSIIAVEMLDNSIQDHYPTGSVLFVRKTKACITSFRYPHFGDMVLLELTNQKGLKQRVIRVMEKGLEDNSYRLLSKTPQLLPGTQPLNYVPGAAIDTGTASDADLSYKCDILGLVIGGLRREQGT